MKRLLAALVTATALVFAACGEEDGPSPEPVVVVGGIALVVLTSPGWSSVQATFFSWPDFVRSFPDVLEGFWLDVRLFLIIEVIVLALGLAIALCRTSTAPALFPLRLLATVYATCCAACRRSCSCSSSASACRRPRRGPGAARPLRARRARGREARPAVRRPGRVLERGAPDEVLSRPQQPETQRFLRRLLAAR